jgi:pimeloyl-ACP methyl ester carboxylesterase
MPRRRAVALAAGVALAGLAAPAAQAQAPPDIFAPCAGQRGVQCATVTVPLDYSGRQPGTINLAVRRIPAVRGPRRGTFVFLAGGPGQSAIDVLPELASIARALLPRYDIVTFDQRGTGRSAPLRCRAIDDAGAEESIVGIFARCGRQLGVRRNFFRSIDSAADLEQVRAALGGPRLALYGVSYGVRVLGVYSRLFPQGIDRLVLDSPVPVNGDDPYDADRVRAIPRVLGEVCAGGRCSFTRSAYGDLGALARRLARRPVTAPFVDGGGSRRRVRVNEDALYSTVISSDLEPVVRVELPASVRSALNGDLAPLGRVVARLGGALPSGRQDDADVNLPLFAATSCAEAPLPWNPSVPPPDDRARLLQAGAQARARAFAPFRASTVIGSTILPVCFGWPATSVPPALTSTPGPAPTLVISGLEDLRTPLANAIRVEAAYPAGQLLRVPFTGHSVVGTDVSTCTARQAFSFLGGGPIRPCNRRPRVPSVAPLAPTRFSALNPLRLRGDRGRTVRAVVRTLDDAVRQLALPASSVPSGRQVPGDGGLVRLGGLRGGALALAERSLTLRRYEYVPGVCLSGTLRPRGGSLVGTLQVECRSAVRAVATLLPGGGLRVRFLVRRPVAFTGATATVPGRYALPAKPPAPGLSGPAVPELLAR